MYPEPIPSMHSYTPAGAGLGLAQDLKYVICILYNLLTQLVVRGEEVQISLREEAEEVVVD